MVCKAHPPFRFFCAIALLACAISATVTLSAFDVPTLRSYVNDYAGMISMDVRGKLENELKDFEGSDSTQLVLLTVPSLEGEAIEDFSMKVAENLEDRSEGQGQRHTVYRGGEGEEDKD